MEEKLVSGSASSVLDYFRDSLLTEITAIELRAEMVDSSLEIGDVVRGNATYADLQLEAAVAKHPWKK